MSKTLMQADNSKEKESKMKQEKPQKEFEISAERFIYELYDSGWRFRFDVPYDYKGSFAPLIAKHLVGWCDASRLQVRPRTGEFAVMCEIDGEKFWFHVLPPSLDCILDELELARNHAKKGK